MAWGSNAFASSVMKQIAARPRFPVATLLPSGIWALFYRRALQGLGDGVADDVGELLAQVAQGAADGRVQLGLEVLQEPLLEIGGEAMLDLVQDAPQDLAGELGVRGFRREYTRGF